MKLLCFLFCLVMSQCAIAQIKATKLGEKDIPATIKYKGEFVRALHYVDKNGAHIAIITETGNTPAKIGSDNDGTEAALYAYDYCNDGKATKLEWKLYDFVAPCTVDVTAKYISNAFAVTDLNGDGVAEVWLMYRIGCRGDPVPSETKVIMHEGTKKYAMRGSSRTKDLVNTNKYIGGEYTFDIAFKTGPPVFSEYGRRLWEKNVTEQ